MTTILIIDDDQDIRESLAALLQLDDFTALEAPHGDYALRLLDQYSVDLVLTDIFMPEKGGLELILEAREKWPKLKIIAMSGALGAKRNPKLAGSTDSSPSAGDIGADRLLTKPFEHRDLLDLIEELVTVEGVEQGQTQNYAGTRL